ncbi:hypothetical protein [Pseudoalteromonas sp. bablab_jr004]|uniref:hypothetical protein n=1 Tax=Pseudoalteromonas sp. bablab_jr004 TaxID=2755065 RepID=UPI0018F40C85|nr:hypothetical protein [Pseudoalteromonas sp. bablab_jr004]
MTKLTLNEGLISSPKQFCVSVITARQLQVKILAQEIPKSMTLDVLCQKMLSTLAVNQIEHIVIQRIDFSKYQYDSLFSLLTNSGIQLSFEPIPNESALYFLPLSMQRRIKFR